MQRSAIFFSVMILLIGVGDAMDCHLCTSSIPNNCKSSYGLLGEMVPCDDVKVHFLEYCGIKVYIDKRLQARMAVSQCELSNRPINWNFIERNYCHAIGHQEMLECEVCATNLTSF